MTFGTPALRPVRRVPTLVVALTALLCGTARAQEAQPRIAVRDVRVSADTIALGDRFALEVDVHLAPGSVAFVPDSIVGRGFEPFGPVEWSASDRADGGLDLSVTYPLIAFGVGTVAIPEFEVYAAVADEATRAGLARPERPVGDFEGFVDNVALVPSARLSPVASRQVWVASVLHLDEVADGIAPRPPADVAGGDRNWPATLLTLVFGVAFLGVSTVTVKDWVAGRAPSESEAPPSPHAAALRALDELAAGPLLAEGRTREFFTRSSEIARRYVEGFEARWGPAWTGTELMDDLTRRSLASAPDPAPLRREIEEAERVKFGGVRPAPDLAREHVDRVRAWIAAAPPPGEAS